MKLKPYPEYKDSGLAWLGGIPAHWEVLRSKYVLREIDVRSSTGEEVHLSMSQKLGLVPSADIEERRLVSESYVGAKLCEPGDIVLNRLKAHLGVFALVKQAGLVSPDYTVFRPRCHVCPRYFESVLRTPMCRVELRKRAKGVVEGFWRLYTDDFYEIALPSPRYEEQERIISFIDGFDSRINRLIRAKRRLIELLNEQKQAIIHQAVTRGLDPNVCLKPSGIDWLGLIPENYRRTKLGRICISIRDGTHNPPPAVEGIHRLLSVRNIIDGRFVTRADDRTMSPAAFDELQRSYTVNEGDVVLALVGATTGKSAVVEPMEDATVQRSIGILRPNLVLISSHYLDLVIRSEIVQAQIRRVMDKYAAQPGIYLNEVGTLTMSHF